MTEDSPFPTDVMTSEPKPKRTRGGQRNNQSALKHGLYPLKNALNKIDLRSIDRRTSLGIELARRREQIFTDIGGREKVSEIKADLIEKLLRTDVMIESIDTFLFQQPSLINRRKKSLHPVVRERAALVDSALRLAQAIGLERQAVPEVDLKTYLAQRANTAAAPAVNSSDVSSQVSTTEADAKLLC
jgi:hypothetical protein